MLLEIYEGRKEKIDNIIKQAEKKIKEKVNEINYEENKEIINKIEENYSIKIANICKEVYIQGLKDGINIITESKNP